MSFKNSELHGGTDDDKMNSHYQDLLNQQKKTMDSSGSDIKNNPNHNPSPMTGSDMMGFTAMLEAMDKILDQSKQDDPEQDMMTQEVESEPTDNSDLLDKLNKIFTPVLVMQKLEQQVADQTNAEMSEAAVLNEKTMIKFDDTSRMAQLQAICALLIAQKKNTEKWQMYKKAAAIKTQMKLGIQKEEYEAAKILAQQYLIKVSTTNNSSVARDAAKELLPQTQH